MFRHVRVIPNNGRLCAMMVASPYEARKNVTSINRTIWSTLLAPLTLATLVFPANPVKATVIKIVSPSPWADTQAPGEILHGEPDYARLQQVFTAEDFMGLPEGNRMLIAISWRSDGAGQGEGTSTYSNFLARMCTTERAVGELSMTYAENWGEDLTTVWEGGFVRSISHTGPVGGPNEFDDPIRMQTPFVYNPNGGNLLLELQWEGRQNDGNISFDWLGDTNQNFTQYIWSLNHGPQAGYSSGGLVCEFTFVPELFADFDVDGNVDSDDFGTWQAGFGTTDSASHGDGDADGDSDVDGHDFLTWQRQFGAIRASLGNAAVPEPASTALLLTLTALTLARCRMRRR